jgi:hypothetical protein
MLTVRARPYRCHVSNIRSPAPGSRESCVFPPSICRTRKERRPYCNVRVDCAISSVAGKSDANEKTEVLNRKATVIKENESA